MRNMNLETIQSILKMKKINGNLLKVVELYQQERLDNSSFLAYLEDAYPMTLEQQEQLKEIFPIAEKNKIDGPIISIIIPTYKRGEMICKAVDSVLKQYYQNYEIIIVDDCSPDNTKQIIQEKYGHNEKVKYFCNQQNSGAGISRKNGYLHSNGKFLIFMDDDDYLIDDYFFQKAISIFQLYEENLAFVSGNSFIKYEKENEYSFKPLNLSKKVDNIEYLKGFQTDYMKPNSTFTTIFNKEYIEDIDNVTMLNDSSIYMRALLEKPVYLLDDIVGVYRVHDKNMTFSLKLPFLLENLQEKKNIYDIINKRHSLKQPEEWLYRQIMLTARYYVVYTRPNYKEFCTLIKWCWNNAGKRKYKILMQLIKSRLASEQKREVKKIEA